VAHSDDKTLDHNSGSFPSSDGAKTRRQSEGAQAPIIPDACNLGIVLRTVGAIVGLGMLAAFATSTDPFHAVARAGEIAAVLVPSVLMSLALLCAARRVVNGLSFRVQWLTGCGLPAVVTAITTLVVREASVIDPQATHIAWALASRALIAAIAAWVFIEYFRLRARAYSPSFSEARLQALQARIRPHFLFNSLNTVLGLMRRDPRRAEATLENLADLFRVFMRDARELVPLDDEVVTCKEYLAIEQLRIGERLQVVWNLDEMPGDALLPSLLLQPLIENAVHHGIEPSTEPGVVEITVRRVGERVAVEILNPISPTPPVRPGNQMALSNVRERLMLLYDMEAELSSGADGDRFRLKLEFPYRKERRRRDVRRYFDPDR
jgi:two-component system, LytTR family, sensor histidine kinase AlgZ